MAGVASLNTVSLSAPSSAAPGPSAVRVRSATVAAARRFPSLRAARRVVAARALDADDEWGKEPVGEGATAVAEEVPAASEVAGLKQKLKAALYGTERGLRASSETRAEVVELITQLEARNPTPAPTEALTLLNGKWILA
jgi:hypothetical protein